MKKFIELVDDKGVKRIINVEFILSVKPSKEGKGCHIKFVGGDSNVFQESFEELRVSLGLSS